MKKIFIVFISLLLLSGCSEVTVKPENLQVMAFLTNNQGFDPQYYPYNLEIEVTIDGEKVTGGIYIYPYFNGSVGMSFNEIDENKYYVPGNIGMNGADIPFLQEELKKFNKIIDNHEAGSYLGFHIPTEQVGTLKTKLNVHLNEELIDFTDMYVFIIGYEKDKPQWIKRYPIQFEENE